MDYIQKYREALARARELSKTITGANYEYIFPELKEKEKPNGGIVLEDFNEGNGFYKVNLAYLNKEQVEEIETMVKEWNHGLSEDEKVRKALIEYYSFDEDGHSHALDNITPEQIVDWLKKQGESVEINPDEIIEECYQDNADHIIDIVTEQGKSSEWSGEDEKIMSTIMKEGDLKPSERKWFKSLKYRIQSKQSNKLQGKTASEAIKEENVDNVNKVESKFHEDDWVVRKDGILFNGRKFAKIIKINKSISQPMYLVDCGNWLYEDEIKLWTLSDAQDGDILVSSKNQPFIYNGWFDDGSVGAHCGLNVYSDFVISNKLCNWTDNKNIKPATKEERNSLFNKMNPLGWVWNPETKELNRLNKNEENNN